MESLNALELDDEALETSCLARESCIEKLLREAPPGCLYCTLGDFEHEDD